LQLVAFGTDAQLYHTSRHPDGTWQDYFGLVEGQVSGGASRYRALGCAGVGDGVQVVGVRSDGHLYHTIRNPDGTWQSSFGLIEGRVHGGPLSFTGVSCGGVGKSLHVVESTF
jgi:hypothetical protein